MSISVAHYPEENRLDLTIEDKLDLSHARQVLQACEYIDDCLITCVIDASRLVCVFDSGLAMLTVLMSKLTKHNVRLVLIGQIDGLCIDSYPLPVSILNAA